MNNLVDENKPDKLVEIIVNGSRKQVSRGLISYEEVIILAFGSYDDSPNVVYTITYYKGSTDKPKGTLTVGQSVRVKKEMIFNVTRTDKS